MFQTKFKLKVFDGTLNVLPSKTVQSEKDNCDINVLYKRFVKQNGYDPVLQGPPVEVDMDHFNDVSMIDGMLGMFDKVDEYQQTFMRLPSEVRAQFFNDPANLGKALSSTDPKVLERVGIILKGGVKNETPSVPQPKPENIPQNGPEVA